LGPIVGDWGNEQTMRNEVTKDFSDTRGFSPLEKEFFADLLDNGERQNDKLFWAIRYGNEAVIKRLIEEGVDINGVISSKHGSDTTPLEDAARSENPNRVKLLLEHDADANQKRLDKDGSEKSPLSQAAHSENPDIVKLLLDYDADVNQKYKKRDDTVLHNSMFNNSFEVVKLLLDSVADLNAKNRNDLVPFMYLIKHIKTVTNLY
jgi:ankyrin repeat protein